jgi:hypothetical protein
MLERLKSEFGWLDVFKMGVSLCAGFGLNWILRGDATTGFAIVALCAVAIGAVVALDRLRVRAHKELEHAVRDLQRSLREVHATVRFDRNESTSAGYDVATEAVRQATDEISVLGDYCPPVEAGNPLATLPENRDQYLQAIEDLLTKRSSTSNRHAPSKPFKYTRYVQRPIDIYDEIDDHAKNGTVTLQSTETDGDLQALEHCRRVMEIERGAPPGRIEVEIRVTPFLPNAPSILVVDNKEIQFTIPERKEGGEKHGNQALLGVLVMRDRRNGKELCEPFQQIFRSLNAISQRIIGIEPAQPASMGSSDGRAHE